MAEMPRIPHDVARERAERAARFLAADPRVKLVFLFGSAADPDRTIPVRDVDLGVLTDPPLDLRDLLRLGEAAALHAGGDIDLVSLNDAGVVLAHEVVNTGRCLYSNPPELETQLVCRIQMRYLDFKYYLDEQWRIAGERLEERLRGSDDTNRPVRLTPKDEEELLAAAEEIRRGEFVDGYDLLAELRSKRQR